MRCFRAPQRWPGVHSLERMQCAALARSPFICQTPPPSSCLLQGLSYRWPNRQPRLGPQKHSTNSVGSGRADMAYCWCLLMQIEFRISASAQNTIVALRPGVFYVSLFISLPLGETMLIKRLMNLYLCLIKGLNTYSRQE